MVVICKSLILEALGVYILGVSLGSVFSATFFCEVGMCVSVQSCDHRNVVRVLQVVHELNVSLVTSSCGLLPSFSCCRSL